MRYKNWMNTNFSRGCRGFIRATSFIGQRFHLVFYLFYRDGLRLIRESSGVTYCMYVQSTINIYTTFIKFLVSKFFEFLMTSITTLNCWCWLLLIHGQRYECWAYLLAARMGEWIEWVGSTIVMHKSIWEQSAGMIPYFRIMLKIEMRR